MIRGLVVLAANAVFAHHPDMHRVAMLVLFLKRPGGQSQLSAQLQTQLADRTPLADLANERAAP